MVYLLIFSILAISIAIYVSTKVEDNYSASLSYAGLSLIENSNSIYEELYFRNEILNLVINESVVELGKQGGSLSGDYVDGYKIWSKNVWNCWPSKESLNENYLKILENKMDFYEPKDYDLRVNEELDKLKIIVGGVSKNTKGMDYETVSNSDESTYILDYNFEDFLTKIDNIKNILSKCNNTELCWTEEKNKFGEWFKSLIIDGKVYKVELFSSKLGGEEVIIKGAIDFGDGSLKC